MKDIQVLFDHFKCKSPGDLIQSILIRNDENKVIAYLKPIIQDYPDTDGYLPALLSRWRAENPTISTGNFEITIERTQKWLDNLVIGRSDRLLFIVMSIDNVPLGHIGFSNFDFERETAELDSVLRGVKEGYPGLMTFATRTLMDWGYSALELKDIELSVYSDNVPAIRFYENLGFETINQVPLVKVTLVDEEKFERAPEGYQGEVEKYYLTMRYIKNKGNYQWEQ